MKFLKDNDKFLQDCFSILGSDYISVDVETSGLDCMKNHVITVQIATKDDIYVIDARRINPQLFSWLFNQLALENKLIIGHNLKFDLSFLTRLCKDFPRMERLFDTMYAYGILNNGLTTTYISLRDLVSSHLKVFIDKDLRDSFQFTVGELTDEQIEYAATDVKYLYDLYKIQSSRLKEVGLIRTAKLEFKLIPVVVKMEQAGIGFSKDVWLSLSKNIPQQLSEIEYEMSKYFNDSYFQGGLFSDPKIVSFNPRSTVQIMTALKSLGINIKDTRETTLKDVDHDLVRLLLKHRELSKVMSTYGESFLKYVSEDGRIHAKFEQLGTASGRFSSNNPNLQNIPAGDHRKAFVAEEGNCIITADFSQIELRAAAVLSKEEKMIKEYNELDPDLHRLTASVIFGVPPNEITNKQRSIGKNANFSALYGISSEGFSMRYKTSKEESQEIISKFWSGYPKLKSYMKALKKAVVQSGYTETAIGRKRYFNLLGVEGDKAALGRIEREGANFPVQGTSADILKQSLLNIDLAIEPLNGKLVNTVHDEIVVEVPEENQYNCVEVVSHCMENAAKSILGDVLPWKTSIKVGRSWEK